VMLPTNIVERVCGVRGLTRLSTSGCPSDYNRLPRNSSSSGPIVTPHGLVFFGNTSVSGDSSQFPYTYSECGPRPRKSWT
jgi:hypothetical protein